MRSVHQKKRHTLQLLVQVQYIQIRCLVCSILKMTTIRTSTASLGRENYFHRFDCKARCQGGSQTPSLCGCADIPHKKFRGCLKLFMPKSTHKLPTTSLQPVVTYNTLKVQMNSLAALSCRVLSVNSVP